MIYTRIIYNPGMMHMIWNKNTTMKYLRWIKTSTHLVNINDCYLIITAQWLYCYRVMREGVIPVLCSEVKCQVTNVTNVRLFSSRMVLKQVRRVWWWWYTGPHWGSGLAGLINCLNWKWWWQSTWSRLRFLVNLNKRKIYFTLTLTISDCVQ